MTQNTNAGVTLTGAGIEFFQKNAALRGLSIEVATGMKLSRGGSGIQACQAQGLLPAGRTTKNAALRKAVAKMQELYPDFEVKGSLAKALAIAEGK